MLSDIHLVKRDKGPPDVDIELRNGLLRFLPKLLERFPDLSFLIVCGDVAFQGIEQEYSVAAAFLREIQSVLDNPRVLVIPGNHDVHLATADLAQQRVWRAQPRVPGKTVFERDQLLADLLDDPEAGPGLFEPLAAYNDFASAYRCELSPEDPCWTVHQPLDHRFELQLRGMTSVLVSDRHDKKDRLLLGSVQVADLEAESPGVVTITFCHHPYEWLLDGEAQRGRIITRSVLHITGHEHEHEVKVDAGTGSVHLCLGALQPTRADEWEPRVYGVGIDVQEDANGFNAIVDVFGARWDQNRFVADVDERHAVPILPPERGKLPPPPSQSRPLVRLTERFASLPSSDRLQAARAIDVDVSTFVNAPSYKEPAVVVQHAIREHQLHLLWNEVARLHGNQSGEDNPFEESE